MEKQKILFVDDEPNILLGINRLLRSYRHEWDMEFVNSGREALDKLETESFKIIISDLLMPEMNGVELLGKVRDLYPDMIRFILSGHGNNNMILQSVGVAHQFMAKPCDADILKDAITRAVHLQDLLKSEQILNIVKDGTALPTLPELYQELTEALDSPNSTGEGISRIISKDVSISAKILQLVNSAFFGLSRNIDSVLQAVTLLGAETINNLVLVTHVFGEFDEAKVEEFDIRGIYSHSHAVGASAKKLMKLVTKNQKLSEESMLAGMVHELGKLVLINSDHESWRTLYLDRHNLTRPFFEAERETLGTTYCEIGAYLIGLWGLSSNVVEAVAFHATPSAAPCTGNFNSLTALYLANKFDEIDPESSDSIEHIGLDMDYLKSVGIIDRIDEFAQICIEEKMKRKAT